MIELQLSPVNQWLLFPLWRQRKRPVILPRAPTRSKRKKSLLPITHNWAPILPQVWSHALRTPHQRRHLLALQKCHRTKKKIRDIVDKVVHRPSPNLSIKLSISFEQIKKMLCERPKSVLRSLELPHCWNKFLKSQMCALLSCHWQIPLEFWTSTVETHVQDI